MAGANARQLLSIKALANSNFDQRYPKLKHLDKKDILAVVESCDSNRGSLTHGLECLIVAILYPDIALQCNKVRLTLEAVAELTEATEPTALSTFHGIASNSLLDDPLGAISDYEGSVHQWHWFGRDWDPKTQAWEHWLAAGQIPGAAREVAREAYKATRQQFSEIWELNERITDQAKLAAQELGVDRIHCLADGPWHVRMVLQDCLAPKLREIQAQLDGDENLEQVPGPAIAPLGPRAEGNPFKGNSRPSIRKPGYTWAEVKARLKTAQRGAVIWNQNLQSRASALALAVLLISNPVVWILFAALPFTVLSTLRCEMPDSIPAIDSDFFAGLSSTVSGFAGLFAIISSLWRPDMYDAKRRKKFTIDSQFPNTFKALLCVSVLSGVASVAVYPWESPVSIPLAFASNVAQNVATLLIVQGSTRRITELER